tara:strand:+ start:100 stop:573 length:474 start_codon:yes stop_codon:yes gene_type:complete
MALTKINLASGVTGTLPTSNYTDNGKILQAVHYRKDADVSKSSDGVVHANINITPSSSSSKILVIISATIEGAGGTGDYAFIYLRRNISSSITTTVQIANALGYQATGGKRHTISCNSLDEPNTTSEVTYELYHDESAGGATYQYYETNYTLLEIGA